MVLVNSPPDEDILQFLAYTEKTHSSFVQTEKPLLRKGQPDVASMIELRAQNPVKIQASKSIQENGTFAVHHLHNNTFHTESDCTVCIFSWCGPISKGARHIALQIMDKGCGTPNRKGGCALYGSSLCSCSLIPRKPHKEKSSSEKSRRKVANSGEGKINSKHKTKETDLDILKLTQVKFPVLTSQKFYIVMESRSLKYRSVKRIHYTIQV